MSDISLEDLFKAWNEFKIGKRGKKDVQIFESNLEENLFDLYGKLQISNRKVLADKFRTVFA